MPIHEYQVADSNAGCDFCRRGFEKLEKADERLSNCPQCGAPVEKLISAPSVGSSRTGFDRRAGEAGFHKLKRLGKGEYEKQY